MRRRHASIAVAAALSVGGCRRTPTTTPNGEPEQTPRDQAQSGLPTMHCGPGPCPTMTDPLFIIDGVPLDPAKTPARDTTTDSTKRFRPFNADEIDSIAVWRGDSAVRRFGSQGKNGVILIWTKRGAKAARSDSAPPTHVPPPGY